MTETITVTAPNNDAAGHISKIAALKERFKHNPDVVSKEILGHPEVYDIYPLPKLRYLHVDKEGKYYMTAEGKRYSFIAIIKAYMFLKGLHVYDHQPKSFTKKFPISKMGIRQLDPDPSRYVMVGKKHYMPRVAQTQQVKAVSVTSRLEPTPEFFLKGYGELSNSGATRYTRSTIHEALKAFDARPDFTEWRGHLHSKEQQWFFENRENV